MEYLRIIRLSKMQIESLYDPSADVLSSACEKKNPTVIIKTAIEGDISRGKHIMLF